MALDSRSFPPRRGRGRPPTLKKLSNTKTSPKDQNKAAMSPPSVFRNNSSARKFLAVKIPPTDLFVSTNIDVPSIVKVPPDALSLPQKRLKMSSGASKTSSPRRSLRAQSSFTSTPSVGQLSSPSVSKSSGMSSVDQRRKRKAATRRPPQAPLLVRAPSEELGEGNFAVHYNKQTGRPIRESAGRKSLNPDYQDSRELSPGSESSEYDPSDDEENTTVKSKSNLLTNLKQRRRKARSQTPPLPPLSPMLPDFESRLGALGEMPTNQHTATDLGPNAGERCKRGPDVLSLTFNIAPGFEGPLRVEIPLSGLLDSNARPCKRVRTSDYFSDSSSSVSPTSFSAVHPQSRPASAHADSSSETWGWSTLPAELRNRIYHLVFYQPDDNIDFHHPKYFKLSGQFLRTCKQVHSEGREILYSENSFCFERNRSTRCAYWSPEPKEIGWKDIRFFLSSIGSQNLSLIRDIRLICDDGMPSTNPGLNIDERRFVHDVNLIECLHILAEHGQLRSIKMCLMGRRMMSKIDERFLAALTAIKADEAKIIDHPRLLGFGHYGESRVRDELREAIEKAMTRKKKMYANVK